MNIERETAYQLLLAGGAVLLFVAAVIFVGTTYGISGAEGGVEQLTTQGGFVLVGTIGLFVLLMLIAGLFLERQEF